MDLDVILTSFLNWRGIRPGDDLVHSGRQVIFPDSCGDVRMADLDDGLGAGKLRNRCS